MFHFRRWQHKVLRWFFPPIAVQIHEMRRSHSPDALGFVSLTSRPRQKAQGTPMECGFLTDRGPDNWEA